MRKLSALLGIALISFIMSSCSVSNKDTLNIYNCGEYIDEDLLDKFQDEYNVQINYVTFDSNETAITKMNSESYDIVVPSDYAIEQLAQANMISKLDWSKIEGFTKNDISTPLLSLLNNLSEEENGWNFLDYAVPYFFGNVGICYDANKVDEEDVIEQGWDIFRMNKYKNKIAYYDSSRDGFMPAYKSLGYSMNSTNKEETKEAFKWIKDVKKKSNCAFKTDELLSEMPDGKYAISLMYSGDAIYAMMEQNANVDLKFYVPEQGTNVFADGMVIPKNAKHVDLAYKFISFMTRPENAKANSIYVGYTSAVNSVYEELVLEDEEFYDYSEYYHINYNMEVDEIYRYNPEYKIILNDYWLELKLS